MDLKEIGVNTRNWVDSAQGRNYRGVLVNAALNLRVSFAREFAIIIIAVGVFANH